MPSQQELEIERSRDNEERKILGWIYDISNPSDNSIVALPSRGLKFKLLEPAFSTTLSQAASGPRTSNPDAFIESDFADRPNLVIEAKLGIRTEAEFRRQFNEHFNIDSSNYRACSTASYDLVYLAKPSVINEISSILASQVQSSSGRRVVLWRLLPGEKIELADPARPNHSDLVLNSILSKGIPLSSQPKTPILFLRKSPMNLKAQALLTHLFMKGLPTRSKEFTISYVRSSIFPLQLEEDEIRRILRFCKDAVLVNWKGREEFELNVTYGNIASESTFFLRVQALSSPESLLRADTKQVGLRGWLE